MDNYLAAGFDAGGSFDSRRRWGDGRWWSLAEDAGQRNEQR
jgi:hypothetical protein